jgi:hypothetical protein
MLSNLRYFNHPLVVNVTNNPAEQKKNSLYLREAV